MNDILVIGLGVMGSNLALNIADHHFKVAVFNRTYELTEKLLQTYQHPNISGYADLTEAIQSLKLPRKVMLMVSAGNAVDWVINQVSDLLSENDILIDGGNSYYKDTMRRQALLKEKGIVYFGVGISGGAYGARYGASIMVGGDATYYALIEPIFNAIGAHSKDGDVCSGYMGSDGAGHFVKMVHNGIEYADMQLISEAYVLLKQGLHLSNEQISKRFNQWNDGELNSFLLTISAHILVEKDTLTESSLIDKIKDCASQKGTGKWSSQVAYDLNSNASLIQTATNARIISTQSELRNAFKTINDKYEIKDDMDLTEFTSHLRKALYLGKVITYAQGFDMYRNASFDYHWQLPMQRIAQIFKAGCIIQSKLLTSIEHAYLKHPQLSHLLLSDEFKDKVNSYKESLVKVVNWANTNNIALPTLSASLTYLQQISSPLLGANLIQAQRDYFGAHMFQRNDREGTFHHLWNDNINE